MDSPTERISETDPETDQDAWPGDSRKPKRIRVVLAYGGGCLVIAAGLFVLVTLRAWPAIQRTVYPNTHGDILALACALDDYAILHDGEYPKRLDVLVMPDENGHTFLGLLRIPLDPWDRPYRYDPPRTGRPEPRVYTLGRDGVIGGEGDDADLSSLQLLGGEF